MTHAIEVAAKSDAMVGGRQLLHIVFNHYKISDEIGLVYNFSDLMAVKLRGDNALAGFLLSWDSVLDGISEEPSVIVKETLFIEQLRSCTVIEEEIAHYDRMPPGHADRTYEFLRLTVQRYLQRKRQNDNRKAVASALGGGGGRPPTAAAADSPKKGKGKHRGRSASPSGSSDRAKSPKGKGKGKGVCFAFQRNECTRGKDCKFSHAAESGGGSPRGRSQSPKPKGGGKSPAKTDKQKKSIPCRFEEKGSCKMGSSCQYKHSGGSSKSAPAAESPSPKPKAKAKAVAGPAIAIPATSVIAQSGRRVTFGGAEVRTYVPHRPWEMIIGSSAHRKTKKRKIWLEE